MSSPAKQWGYIKIGPDEYRRTKTLVYQSPRYKKTVVVPLGRYSDGATGAFDILSDAWWVHDEICKFGEWADGAKVSREQAAQVLSDILWTEGRYFRAFYWKWFTYLFGCTKLRKDRHDGTSD